MRVAILLYISALLLSFVTLQSRDNEKNNAYIYLGSGYKNDTVSLVVDESQVLKDEVVSSKKERNDLTGIYLKITKDSIFWYKGNLTISEKFMKRDGISVKVLLTINAHPYSYTMHLNQGRYLFISKHLYYYNVYFNQFKKQISLY